MRLFDDIVRNYHGPANYAEPDFSFLNCSAQPEFQCIRNLLERWFGDFPPSGKEHLKSRFCSKDNRQHWGAFFELYCRALLQYQGFTVELHQPADPLNSTQPDFLVYRSNEPVFYMESTVATGSGIDHATQAILDQVRDTLNSLKSPDFFVGFKVEKESLQAPSASRIRSVLKKQLQDLNPDELSKNFSARGFDALPRWDFSDKGWEFVFFPIPKIREARNKPRVRPMGLEFVRAQWIDSRRPLLNALKSKASRYGNLDSSYIIAVNAMDDFVDETDIIDALFGQEKFLIDVQTKEVSPSRAPSGLWVGPQGERNTRVSAVLIVTKLKPWTIATSTPVLWHNPWANNELETDLWQGLQMVPDLENSTMIQREGSDAWEILQLNTDWPYKSE